jgi:hypothetical protein
MMIVWPSCLFEGVGGGRRAAPPREGVAIASRQAPRRALSRLPHLLHTQAHFTAPSSERRKLMVAPLSQELKNKHQVRTPGRIQRRGSATRSAIAAQE